MRKLFIILITIINISVAYKTAIANPDNKDGSRECKSCNVYATSKEFMEAIERRDINTVFKYIKKAEGIYVYGANNVSTAIWRKSDLERNFDNIFDEEFINQLKEDKNKAIAVGSWRYLFWSKNYDAYAPISIYFDYTDDPLPVSITNENAVVIVASFDCTKAKTKTEVSICSDPTLSELDRKMFQQYSLAKVYLTGKDRENLSKSQTKFLTQRDRCGSNKDCIAEKVQARIKELSELIENEQQKPDTIFSEDELKKFNGLWQTKEFNDLHNCTAGSQDVLYHTSYDVLIDYPKITITKKKDGKSFICKVKQPYFSSTYKVENSIEPGTGGNCGTDFSRFGFWGNYVYLELTNFDSKAATKKEDSDISKSKEDDEEDYWKMDCSNAGVILYGVGTNKASAFLAYGGIDKDPSYIKVEKSWVPVKNLDKKPKNYYLLYPSMGWSLSRDDSLKE